MDHDHSRAMNPNLVNIKLPIMAIDNHSMAIHGECKGVPNKGGKVRHGRNMSGNPKTPRATIRFQGKETHAQGPHGCPMGLATALIANTNRMQSGGNDHK